MQIHFLRHGRAVEPEEWQGAEPERPLTPDGRAELRQVARGLRWLGVAPDTILTSPFVRALETAEIVGAVLNVDATPVTVLAPGCDLDGLTAALAAASKPPNSALVVGHEPDLSALIGLLIGWQGPARVEMKKGSCARVDVSLSLTTITTQELAEHGTLIWLLRAKQLARLGK